jgi:hypothetical protein
MTARVCVLPEPHGWDMGKDEGVKGKSKDAKKTSSSPLDMDCPDCASKNLANAHAAFFLRY